MSDFRRRNLMILGGAALVSVLLAGVAVYQESQATKMQFTPREFLPGFAAQVKNSARIHVVSHSGSFDVAYSPAKGWVLPAKGNYPADFNQVRHTLLGLAALETVEPKTARADWLSYLGLETPPKGNGIEIVVSDAGGHEIAGVITGNTTQIDTGEGGTGVFVRRPGDNQSYLARTVFTPHGDLSDWVDTNVMSVDAARVNSVTITPFSGAPYTVTREHPSDADFRLDGPPPAKGLAASTSQIDLVPQIVSGFAFTDVKPAPELDFSKAAHLTAHTFDDQNIRMDAVKVNDAVWVRISAQPDPGTPTMQKQEAAMINARAANWAYELATERGQFFSMTRDNLFAKAQAQPGEGQPGEGQPGEGMPPQGGPGHVPLSSMTGHSLTGARH
ncbi:MAG TPA: DUF4340 domain-containing protein [Rhizomicrobium sp.]|jgi:hypothetical protein|nr:DUF4340 domain-containing protein [Rhizomicrobium sp.]